MNCLSVFAYKGAVKRLFIFIVFITNVPYAPCGVCHILTNHIRLLEHLPENIS